MRSAMGGVIRTPADAVLNIFFEPFDKVGAQCCCFRLVAARCREMPADTHG
jgi:hypothetical protein